MVLSSNALYNFVNVLVNTFSTLTYISYCTQIRSEPVCCRHPSALLPNAYSRTFSPRGNFLDTRLCQSDLLTDEKIIV